MTSRFVELYRCRQDMYTYNELVWLLPDITEKFLWKACGILPIMRNPCNGLDYLVLSKKQGPFFGALSPKSIVVSPFSNFNDHVMNSASTQATNVFYVQTGGVIRLATYGKTLAEQLDSGDFEHAIITGDKYDKKGLAIVFVKRVPWQPECSVLFCQRTGVRPIQSFMIRKVTPSEPISSFRCMYNCKRCDCAMAYCDS